MLREVEEKREGRENGQEERRGDEIRGREWEEGEGRSGVGA